MSEVVSVVTYISSMRRKIETYHPIIRVSDIGEYLIGKLVVTYRIVVILYNGVFFRFFVLKIVDFEPFNAILESCLGNDLILRVFS